MKKVFILCEGKTEFEFIRIVLSDFLINQPIEITPILYSTKRTGQKNYTGGGIKYSNMLSQIKKLINCRDSFTTIFIDYYGLPREMMNFFNPRDNLYKKVEQIELKIEEDINRINFFAGIMVHEFESLLFSQSSAFNQISSDHSKILKIERIKREFTNPEYINNSPQTTPSKRLEAIFPNYSKINDGITVANEIGISKMIEECPHFAKWIQKVVELK